MSYQFIYPDFIDKATGKTLVATPGSTYTVTVASGRNPGTPAYPNDGRWSAQAGVPFLAVLPGKPAGESQAKPDSLAAPEDSLNPASPEKGKGPDNAR